MHSVAVALRPGIRLFDFAIALEVWATDRTDDGVPRFETRVCSPRGSSVPSDLGSAIAATHSYRGLEDADLVVVPGSADPAREVPPQLVKALRAADRRGATVAALCSGAFALGQAGLLDGRRATTHWLHIEALRSAFPNAVVQEDVLFVQDGTCWTSAGTAAGIDLCLHLVERAHGAAVASVIARRMVTPLYRGGDHRQQVYRAVPAHERVTSLSTTLDWARGRLEQTLSVADLARHASLSERTLTRRFTELLGSTPQKWLTVERLHLSKALLETTDQPVDAVAQQAGFGSPLTLRRHFRQAFGATPAAYRRDFRCSARNRDRG